MDEIKTVLAFENNKNQQSHSTDLARPKKTE